MRGPWLGVVGEAISCGMEREAGTGHCCVSKGGRLGGRWLEPCGALAAV